MSVTLKVVKNAQFVMLEIPIPAGCTYDSKNGYFLNSCHTEFFRDHVAVFFDHINPGVYTYIIDLLPRFAGRYTLNPVKASLMYFPTFSSNNAVKMIDLR
jgi:alpha-2-macroglobulin